MIVSHIGNDGSDFPITNHGKLIALKLVAALRHSFLVLTIGLYVEGVNVWSANNDYFIAAYRRDCGKV